MYRTVSNKIIREFRPCYDPSRFIKDETEELTIKEGIQKYRSIVPDKDIIWLLCRKEFMSEKDLILFGVWCAREALKFVEKPDPRSIEACNVAERYANNEITREELLAANDANFDAAHYAIVSATVYAIRAAANAVRIVYFVTSNTISNNAADATYDAAYNATRSAQLDQLLTYFK